MYQTNLINNPFIYTPIKYLEVIENYDLKDDYLINNKKVIDESLAKYPRIMAVRFDLHFSKSYLDIDYDRQSASNDITKFVKSLQAKIESNIKRRRNKGIRVADCKLSYIWVKEGDVNTAEHYHVVIFLNSDTYNSVGTFGYFGDNIYTKIVEAWNSALHIERQEAQNLVHIPANPVYYLKKNADNFKQVYRDLYKRLSYFAKVETKSYGNKQRSYGHSY